MTSPKSCALFGSGGTKPRLNRAAKERPKVEEDRGQTLVPAEITTAKPAPTSQADVFGAPKAKEKEEKIDVDSVFGKLKELKSAG
jgi:hypothetical protein